MVLSLRLFELLLRLLQLHGQKLDLLVTHRDIFLSIVSDGHLCLETFLSFCLKLLDETLVGLELRLAFFQP